MAKVNETLVIGNSAAMDFDWSSLVAKAGEMLVEYSPKVVLAILVLPVGLRIIKGIQNLVRKACDKGALEETQKGFVTSLICWILKIMLFIAVADMVGVKTTSFVAVLAAGGLAIGLALQGTLANFSGGVLIMVFKPDKMGALIESQGVLGVVKDIQLFSTVLLTPENQDRYCA